ncbi:glycosyltransferase family 2 protein [Spiroplasma taiwanense]|uniref:Glycosyltransferase n=1 Tax=Spiroplasma taiwanense CT-1 TaxID=1276220 RepID=S5LW21_9MOLU|nr:glycosyltransferase family 2 protein [Spiroplasma taiwanense]AGR40791.1 glycosyltransferase [Spiroplasma taiwanense CT-1]
MLISFVLVYQEFGNKVKETIDSIKKQTDNDYEIILVCDRTIEDNSKDEWLKELFWNNSNIKLVFNNSIQGASVSWNTGIDLAEGEYIKFIAQGNILNPDFVETIKKELNNFKEREIDLVEYTVNLTGSVHIDTLTYLEKGKIYNLSSEFDPFAYVNVVLYNKLFKAKILNEFGFKFRRFVRFDLLFVYKVLGQTNSYLFLDTKPLGTVNIGPVSYSVFDVVNQWNHILNYYRRIGKFKQLKDYLNYSYYKVLIHLWLWEIRTYDNKILIKKATAFANRKFEDKRDDFLKNNIIFKKTNDERFKEIVNNFGTYIKENLKRAK